MTNQQQLGGGWLQRANVGFVARLKLIAIDDVLSLVSPQQFPVAGRPLTVSALGLNLTNGAMITELVFPDRICTFTESSSREAGGLQYTLAINTALPSPDEALLAWLDQQQERRWLAIWLGHNQLVYQAGEPGNGLWLTTGRSLTERDALSLTLQGRATHPVWYRDSYPEQLPPDREFDFSFDLSFS